VVFLRDLTFINDGNCETLMSGTVPFSLQALSVWGVGLTSSCVATTTEPMAPTDLPRELPNFEKMVLLGQQILELEAYRKVPYDIEEIPAGM
jgi:hypothetical protein